MPSLRGGPHHGKNVPLQEPYRPYYKCFAPDGRYLGSYVLTSLQQGGVTRRVVRHFLWVEGYDPTEEAARESGRDAGGRFMRLRKRLLHGR